MRILLVSGIWPPDVGGPASHGPEIGRYLVDRGHRVRAVTTADRGGAEDPGFPLTAAPRSRSRALRLGAGALPVIAAAPRAEVIYAIGLYTRSALAATFARVPLVFKLANDPAYERARSLGLFSGTLEEFQQPQGRPALRALKRLRTLSVSRAARVIIPSRYLAEIVIRWGVSAKRVVVIPNPAPAIERSSSREALRERLGVSFPTFVFAGRLVAQKNLPLAISALRKAPEASLVLVGDGPQREEVAEAIAASGVADRVSLKGALPRRQAIEWLRAADAAVLPSAWENFPHAAVEALAAGTPVIATSVGGVPEIIDSGTNGLLVSPGDEEAFAAAMASLTADPGLLERLRRGAESTADRYAPERIFATIEDELREVVQPGGR